MNFIHPPLSKRWIVVISALAGSLQALAVALASKQSKAPTRSKIFSSHPLAAPICRRAADGNTTLTPKTGAAV